MFGKLLPRETSFFDFFDKHAALTIQGTQEFLALAEGNGNVGPRAKRIKEIEHETDVITHDCVEALHKTFITPIERDDIHRLISRMDDIMDFVEAASERIALYEIRVMTRRAGLDLPEELMQQFIAVWPAFEAMVRRIPRDLGRAAEPAHSYRPLRIVRG